MASVSPNFFVTHSLVNVAPQTTSVRKVSGYRGIVQASGPGFVLVRRVDNHISEIEPTALVTRVG